MANRCTRIPEIMFPREGVDLSKWAVIACDQYTSQPAACFLSLCLSVENG